MDDFIYDPVFLGLIGRHEEVSLRVGRDFFLCLPCMLDKYIIQAVPELQYFPGVDLYSDDGTAGTKGTVLSGLPDTLPGDTELWACGPQGMLRAIAAKYPRDGGRILAALESRMACGMGGCMGCVIPTVSGNRRVCVDGPVFSAGEVKWNELSPC